MTRFRRALLCAPILTTLLMAGQCSTLSGGPGTGGSFCDIASPMRPSRSQIATMSVEEKRQALTMLRYGRAHCGWRPGR